MKIKTALAGALLMCGATVVAQHATPDVEMRSAWIATVYRIDWPSSTISSTGNATQIASQKNDLTRMLDSMAVNNMNAANLQIRSRCDAMYKSSYEPWSSDLVSKRGLDPGYDPFEFFVEECHKRGMEAHAWINPYRYESSKGAWNGTPGAYRETHPEWLMDYGSASILNPGLPEVRQRICDIVREICTNYDLDGLLFDDYFYLQGTPMSDDADLYNAYLAEGGTLSQADWRRDNVNQMIADVYRTIKEVKPWVRFGVSPAGLTCTSEDVARKHGVPRCTSGSEYQYNGIFSDPLAWLEQKSLDYISPQIYWGIGYASADYNIICKWWSDRMPAYGRHLFVSHDIASLTASSKAGMNRASGPNVTTFAEYSDEIDLAREYSLDGCPGSIFYSVKFLYKTAPKFAHYLRNTVYTRKALLPPMTWFNVPRQGLVEGMTLAADGTLKWNDVEGMRYAVYANDELLGLSYTNSYAIPADKRAARLEVAIVDRYGNVYNRRTLGADVHTLPAPKLLSPVNGENAEAPFDLQWSAVDGAESYQVEIYDNAAMTTPIGTRRVDGATTVAWSEFNGTPRTGNIWWRVLPMGPNAIGEWSDAASFNLITMAITGPAANATDVSLTPTFTWEGPSRPVTLEIATDEDFNNVVYTAEAPTASHTVAKYALSGYTNYIARIYYRNGDATCISEPVRFTTLAVPVTTPVVARPVAGGTLYADQPISFAPIEGVKLLRVEVSATTAFSSRTSYVSSAVSTTDFTDAHVAGEIKLSSKPLVHGNTYYLRARASFGSADGTVNSEYTEPISFVYSSEDSGVDDVTADLAGLAIEGLTVSVGGNAAIALYNVDGTLAAGGTGRVTAPCGGIYLVRSGAAATKVVLRD